MTSNSTNSILFPDAKLFKYTRKNFNKKSIPWSNVDPSTTTNYSNFDNFIRNQWKQAQSLETNNPFRYNFSRDDCKYKILNCPKPFDGPVVCQLNRGREMTKRKRPDFPSLTEKFDETKFQFKKIKNDEVLCQFEHENDDKRAPSDGSQNYIIVNASPIEDYHILLVSELEFGHNQIINFKTLRLSLDMLLLSNQPGFRVMYNSIWAWASINHLHVHAFYMDHKVGGDVMSIKNEPILIKNVKISRTIDENVYLPAFVWDNLNCEDDENLALEQVEKFCFHLTKMVIPHNIMMLYEGNSRLPRIIVWPRASAFGLQPDPGFDCAVAEMGGHFPYKKPEVFEGTSFEKAIQHIQKNKLEKSVYDNLEKWIFENL